MTEKNIETAKLISSNHSTSKFETEIILIKENVFKVIKNYSRRTGLKIP